MSYKVEATSRFEKQLKILGKRHRSLKKDLAALISQLEENPTTGISLGHNCFKIRLGITSKGRGKAGGGRVVSHVYVSRKTVYLIAIYDKSERGTISDAEDLELISELK